MFESKETEEATTVSTDAPPSYDELLEQVRSLEGKSAYLQLRFDASVNRNAAFTAKISNVEAWIDENYDSIDQSGQETADAIAELLEIEMEITKTFTVNTSISVEVKAPRGFDFDSLDHHSFDVDITASGWGNDWSIETTDIDIDSIEEA